MKILRKAKHTGELTIKSFPAVKKKSARIKVKCYDCKSFLDIYYGIVDDDLEIGGVYGTKEEWHRVFKRVGLI